MQKKIKWDEIRELSQKKIGLRLHEEMGINNYYIIQNGKT